MQKHSAAEYSLVHLVDIVFKFLVTNDGLKYFSSYFSTNILNETATEEQKPCSGKLGGWEMEEELFKYFIFLSHFLLNAGA